MAFAIDRPCDPKDEDTTWALVQYVKPKDFGPVPECSPVVWPLKSRLGPKGGAGRTVDLDLGRNDTPTGHVTPDNCRRDRSFVIFGPHVRRGHTGGGSILLAFTGISQPPC